MVVMKKKKQITKHKLKDHPSLHIVNKIEVFKLNCRNIGVR